LLVQGHLDGELFGEFAECLKRQGRMAGGLISLRLLQPLFWKKEFSSKRLQICFLSFIRTLG
jgi:hypothetical protein